MPTDCMTVEQKAEDIVQRFEIKAGRHPRKVYGKGKHWDIESDDRLIEVKGLSEKWLDFWLPGALFDLNDVQRSRYYIYVVYNIKEKPSLMIINPTAVFRNLEKVTMAWIRPGKVRQIAKEESITDI